MVALEDMRKDGAKITIHKPLECESHAGENILYYCATCNGTACTECVKIDHVGHHCEGILDSESRVRQEMELLLAKSKENVEQLMKSSTGLNSSLEELAHQRSTARDLINESYQSYKAVLEKCRDDALDELNELYHERELKIMKENNEVGKTIDNLEDACRFAAKLLENGTVQEMMYLKQVVAKRLTQLLNSTPKFEHSFNIEFRTDFNRFGTIVKQHFGTFATELVEGESGGTPVPPPPPSQSYKLQSSLDETIVGKLTALNVNGTCAINANNVSGGGGSGGSVSNSPISLPTSMQSSFDGDIGGNLQSFSITQSPPASVTHQTTASSLQGFSSIAEYNIAQLATLAKSSNSSATSPTPQFTLEDLLNNDTAYKNLASLAKLGLNSGGYLFMCILNKYECFLRTVRWRHLVHSFYTNLRM